MHQKNRFAAICATVLVTAALLFSVFFIALETNHDCSREHCAICHQIQTCQTLLSQLSSACAKPAGFGVLCFFALLLILRRPYVSVASSLVSQKVKLLN